MKISIIGTGNLGGTLGRRWAEKGHEIIYGSRDPESDKVRKLTESMSENVKATGIQEAAASTPVVVLATPWPAAEGAIKSAGDLAGKTVIDCTNPLAPNFGGLLLGLTTSAAEKVAEWANGARVVKAFNTTGTKNMANPVYGSQRISMFICGDDAQAKKTVAGLASELDFDVVDCGNLESARYLEPLAMLWIHLVFAANLGQDIAFKLVRR